MKIARIAYLNTEPFFHFWSNTDFTFVSGVPRVLAMAAENHEVIAGPLPLVECWRLKKIVTPLGDWGIAARERSLSVLLLSQRPFKDLDNVKIGVTRETSTSAVLCHVLLREKYGHDATLKRGLDPTDDAWLVIGDQAFEIWAKQKMGAWTQMTDLASEWWEWKKLPFVFAQWVIRRDVHLRIKSLLACEVRDSLEKGKKWLPFIAANAARRLAIEPDKIMEYLNGFNYAFGSREEDSMALFREMVEESQLSPAGH